MNTIFYTGYFISVKKMTKTDFKEYICRPYCMFFKDGQKEEMACQGAQIVESLLRNSQLKAETIQAVMKDPGLWIKHKQTLGRSVCGHCSFRAEDCDFQSATPSEDLEPCGGFIVLAFLKEKNLINEHVLETFQ